MILPFRLLRRRPWFAVGQSCRRLIGIPILLIGIRCCLSLILSFRLLRRRARLSARQGCRRLVWIKFRPVRLVWPCPRLNRLLRRWPRLPGVRWNWPSRCGLSRNLLPGPRLSTLIRVCRLIGILILPALRGRVRPSCRISGVRRRGDHCPAGNRLGRLSRSYRRRNWCGPRLGNNLLALLVDQSRAL